MSDSQGVIIIGGGLAGSEAAYQLARRGIPSRLFEMRPRSMTPAHQTGDLAELVCSNSLKSDLPESAPGLLKQELRQLGSLLLEVAEANRVPAGHALAVDRQRFAREITHRIENHPLIQLVREEVTEIPSHRPLLLASGPLTSPALAASLQSVTGEEYLYFFDAISPVVSADSIDYGKAFRASRYGKGGEDYVNCPFNREQYLAFRQALLEAAQCPWREFEQVSLFEGCLPIEELARRGEDTLRFGPLKPVGLEDPATGRLPYAAVQLRQENLLGDAFNLVGFQNHLRFGDQQRVLRMIPGLEQAEFVRFGQMHRNTFINAPQVLTPALELRRAPGIFIAGQLCGLEGYLEAIATGMLAALQIFRRSNSQDELSFPPETALGGLQNVIRQASPQNYQPVNMTFGLLPPLEQGTGRHPRGRKHRHQALVARADQVFSRFVQEEGLRASG